MAFTCGSISGVSAGGVHESEAELYRNDLLVDKTRQSDSSGDLTSPKACSKPVQTIHIAPITVEKKRRIFAVFHQPVSPSSVPATTAQELQCLYPSNTCPHKRPSVKEREVLFIHTFPFCPSTHRGPGAIRHRDMPQVLGQSFPTLPLTRPEEKTNRPIHPMLPQALGTQAFISENAQATITRVSTRSHHQRRRRTK